MNLKKLFQIQKTLEKAGYFDISRVANEIYSYPEENDIEIEDILKRIEKDEPWEYIRGYAEFRGINFLVTKDTLIPRIETEQIVDIALDLIEKKNIPYSKIIDIGTGTGCIIISLYKELKKNKEEIEEKEKNRGKDKEYTFLATDSSSKALDIAKENAKRNSIKNISFVKKNLISIEDLENNSLILANLPYIPTNQYMELDKSVKDFEPKKALDGGQDGLKYYKELLTIIQKTQKKNIDLIVEIEPSTLTDLKKLVPENTSLKIIKDFREKNRFLLLHFA
ncbi:MAG TPA: HemK/PrmC family methyltransferase [Candidatus Dojkabacteria bacterium]|jgi:release factor glutamine methyltransferase|nr:HemK/PrmC family methyltransferase [Candidatus Dojkabacteria bacterium]